MKKLEFISIEELRKSMTPEQKKEADRLFKKYYGPYLNQEPILCGPEARAAAKGPEALEEYYKDGEKYMTEVDLEGFE